MMRIALGLAVLAACGTVEDDRPPTTEYVTEAILVPSCGVAQCHSAFKRADGYVFDSVEAVQHEVDAEILKVRNPDDADDLDSSLMMQVLLRNVDRMPYDQGLPEPDIQLIRRWVGRDNGIDL